MFEMSQFFLVAGAILVAVAFAVKVYAFRKDPARHAVAAYSHSWRDDRGVTVTERPEPLSPEAGHGAGSGRARGAIWYSSRMVWMALFFLTLSLAARAAYTGHGPFTNQHEFAVSFSWGMLVAYVWAEYRYKARTLALVVLPVCLLMLVYAMTMDSEVRPLVPALQNSWLLTTHVATAVLAYGAFCISFASAVLYLVRPRIPWRGLPSREVLEEIGYRSVVIGYPMLTIMIILGAIWADIAWGRYWSWDPKETASLVLWLMYSAYLHARVVRDWRDNRAAWLLVAGFGAVLFTYFGNHFLGGLHSYG